MGDRLQTSEVMSDAVRVSLTYGDCSAVDLELHSDQAVAAQIKTESHPVEIRDARPWRDSLSLDREGFALHGHTAVTPFESGFIEFNRIRRRDMPARNLRYAQELIPLIAALSGADHIEPQAGRMTVRATARAGMVTSDPTAPLVHLDYTPAAVQDAINLTYRLAGKAAPEFSRVAVYQTWRVLNDPPHDSMLAICDARSVSLDATTVLQTYTPGDGDAAEKIEVRLCAYEPQHRWCYFSNMKPD